MNTLGRSTRTAAIAAMALLLTPFLAQQAFALRIGDLCEVQGARGNDLKGIGLVVGLAGTGDKAADSILRQARLLDRMNVKINSTSDLASKNCAVVVVTATLPSFAKEGTRIDLQVSSLYDCESLEGGTLLDTHLYGKDERVYAVAQGPLSVGGFNVEGGGGSSVRKNHVTVGRVPNGAFVEREVPSTITDGERVTLLLNRPGFVAANRVREALDDAYGEGTASALGAGTINVRIPPTHREDLVGFLAEILETDVESGPTQAKIVVNERTGTIVVGGEVMIKPCQVAHGDLTIAIAATPEVSQPLPFGGGQTVETTSVEMEVEETIGRLMPVQGTSAADVADTLNKLKVTPRDMISIFQALSEAGALQAHLEIM